VVAVVIAFTAYGADARIAAIASAKGLSLALFVLTILWASVYMFNIIDRLKGIEAMGRTTAKLGSDPLVQALLIGWGFSSFIQGVTGFGVPVAVAAPLLIMVGFAPIRAAAIALVGHGWAVTFGSLGSSYYTVQLVTKFPPDVIAPHMAMLFAPVTIASGIMVAHLQGGWRSVRRSLPLVLVVGTAMAFTMWLMAALGVPQVASLAPGLLALVAIAILSRTPLIGKDASATNGPLLPPTAAPQPSGGGATATATKPMTALLGFLPYILLLFLSVLTQIPPVKAATSAIALGLDYPGFATSEGFVTIAEQGYAEIGLFNHPAPLIIVSVIISILVYRATKRWKAGVGREALRLTYGQAITTTVGVCLMVMMAVVMLDTGMTTLLAHGVAKASGPVFPMFSPFIGLLGAFMTGSNTNSNVMFGALQVETAQALGMGAGVTMASLQSIGGAVGSVLAPAKVLVGAAFGGSQGQEAAIWRVITAYVLLLALIAGIEGLLLVHLLPAWLR
jgi:lactate permease